MASKQTELAVYLEQLSSNYGTIEELYLGGTDEIYNNFYYALKGTEELDELETLLNRVNQISLIALEASTLKAKQIKKQLNY